MLNTQSEASVSAQGMTERHERFGSDDYVVFKNVQKTYDGEHLIVKDLNLSVRRGEFLTMLGPSGSGKTTTLMMLAGFETATGGEIYLDTRPINKVPPHKRGIGMVFQNYALFPHMTVGENLAFPLEVRKMPKEEREVRIKRALDMVQMSAFINRRPAQLSGGQQQRIALARALVFDPKLVLMDEPLGALDKQLREHMQFEIKRLHTELGITMVYVTHDQGEALTMSDRIAVFNDGRIQQLASPEDIYERPVNSFVAQFIGENNKLLGTIENVSGGRAAGQRGGHRGNACHFHVEGAPDGCFHQAGEGLLRACFRARHDSVDGRRSPGDHLHGRHSSHAAAFGRNRQLHREDTEFTGPLPSQSR